MTKLCPRGKAAAKRKFKVYPSAYANAYASKICAGKIKDPSGVKRKDFRGPKPSKAMGGRIGFKDGTPKKNKLKKIAKKLGRAAAKFSTVGETMAKKFMKRKEMKNGSGKTPMTPKQKKFAALAPPRNKITYADKIAGATGRTMARGGGLMEATQRLRRQGLEKGGIARGCGAIMSDRRKKTKIF